MHFYIIRSLYLTDQNRKYMAHDNYVISIKLDVSEFPLIADLHLGLLVIRFTFNN